MTNFEKIKDMDIEDMAGNLTVSFVCGRCPIREFCDENDKSPTTTCIGVWKKWLKSEVEDEL